MRMWTFEELKEQEEWMEDCVKASEEREDVEKIREIEITYCGKCVFLYGDEYALCGHPDGVGPDVQDLDIKTKIHPECPLRKKKALVFIKEQ